MNIKTARNETAAALGCSPDELVYITEELLRAYERAIPADLKSGDAVGRRKGNRWGTFGYNTVKKGDRWYYSCGEKSAPGHYGCDTNGKRYYAPVSHAKYVKYANLCSPSKWSVYFLGNYLGGERQYGTERVPEGE